MRMKRGSRRVGSGIYAGVVIVTLGDCGLVSERVERSAHDTISGTGP